MTATISLSAESLMQSAYENRYTWDSDFPGYTAEVTLTDGSGVHTGKVQVNPNLSVSVMDIADDTAKQAITEQMREIAIHRVRRSFAETHGKNSFSLGDTDDTGAVEIIVGGKSAGDRYKVRNNEVCMVHRHIHGIVVTINTISSHQTPSGYLSHRYHSVYRDGQTNDIKGESTYTDLYTAVGGYQILSDRTISANGVSTTYSFKNIQLL